MIGKWPPLNSWGVVLAVLAGCQSPMQAAQSHAARLEAQGQPKAYAEGYAVGCQQAASAAGAPGAFLVKDAARAQADPLYADGWRDGFTICKAQHDSTAQTLGPAL